MIDRKTGTQAKSRRVRRALNGAGGSWLERDTQLSRAAMRVAHFAPRLKLIARRRSGAHQS
jgi:hypothetical protein